jgi:cell wall-associated protease
MKLMKPSSVIAVAAGVVLMTALSNPSSAQSTVPRNWHLLSYTSDSVYGTQVEKAYAELLKNKKSTPIVVAIIDSGFDTTHEDLKPIFWTNPGEIPGNGIDDDHNGYVDDVHGWNFLGGKNGTSVVEDSDESSREYWRYKKLYVNPDSALDKNSKEYAYWQRLKKANNRPSNTEANKENYNRMLMLNANMQAAEKILVTNLHTKDFTAAKLDSIQTTDNDLLRAKTFMTRLLESTGEKGMSYADFKTEFDEYLADLKRKSEIVDGAPPVDNRAAIIGDNYEDINDKYYGNNNVMGDFGFHGTHVSGIIAAVRNNGVGVDGINNNVQIMAVKAVPDGDERDKDIALAIRYAVDNGARIINMSFGKSYSPHKAWVDDAVKYAAAKGVLLVHAAGNEGENNDSTDNFPNPDYLDNGHADNFVTVGASSNGKVGAKIASFSNYGKKTVDLFAPGVQIYSTIPGSKYASASGTSMASPVVAGVAALVLSYYPTLSARQLKYVLEKSASPLPDGTTMVNKPGSNQQIPFADLSVSGGIVNAYDALKLAATLKGELDVKPGKKQKAKVSSVKKG